MKLDGKICIITGGASGIGLEIAKSFAVAGGTVVIADIYIDAADKAAKSLGDGHFGVEMDVTDPDAVQRGIDKLIEAHGQVDVISKVMLGETVDKEFTTVEDVAHTALFLATFPSNALTGQSIVVSHGWRMD